jgi:hypothetical protein
VKAADAADCEGENEVATRLREMSVEDPKPPYTHAKSCPKFDEWKDMGSWVYFIQAGEAGPIKIGKSDDPVARLRSLQTAHHQRLILLGTVRGGEPLEKELHRLHEKDRLLGEWFRPSFEVIFMVACHLHPPKSGPEALRMIEEAHERALCAAHNSEPGAHRETPERL